MVVIGVAFIGVLVSVADLSCGMESGPPDMVCSPVTTLISVKDLNPNGKPYTGAFYIEAQEKLYHLEEHVFGDLQVLPSLALYALENLQGNGWDNRYHKIWAARVVYVLRNLGVYNVEDRTNAEAFFFYAYYKTLHPDKLYKKLSGIFNEWIVGPVPSGDKLLEI